MLRSSPLSRRRGLWLAAAVLLLRAAMPMLASTAAALQGRPLPEVCPVYGVALPAGPTQPHHHDGNHDHDHDHEPSMHASHGVQCVLAGLPGLYAPPSLVVASGAASADTALRDDSVRPEPAAPDDTRRWFTRLQHAPPAAA